MSGRLAGCVAAVLAVLAAAGASGAGSASPSRERGVRSLARERPGPPSSGPVIAVLCYHDVSDQPGTGPSTVSPSSFRDQIRRAREAGWAFLALSELLALKGRPEKIPPRTMVVTFDDGYRSFSEKVLPILREEGVKATLAIVDSFIDSPPPGIPPLMSWDEIRAAERSGFVEIASHSHDLHRYETSNPYRDTGPSVTTRRYLLREGRYENRGEYRDRIREDLGKARRRLREELGHDVAALAWPYGEHNAAARGIAAEAGFRATLGLDGTDARPDDLRAGYLPRVMVHRAMGIGGRDLSWIGGAPAPVRAAQVDLDAVYDPDPAAFRRAVDRMVEKVGAMGATHVFLQGCPDPGGDGLFRDAWFQNHQVPVKADIWSMAAAKLSHAGVAVWIRAPSMNLSWEWEKHPERRIPARGKRGEKGASPWYYRLSPDLPESRRAAIDFFTDIAVYLPIQGVLFDDDAYMLADERLGGSGASAPAAKSEAIRGLIEEIKAAVLAWRPDCRFGRNIYAPAVEHDGVHPGFSQDLAQFLRDYDLTVVMAYARMEGHRPDAGKWAAALARRAARAWVPAPGELSASPPVMLKFQAYDWKGEEWVPGGELLEMVREARKAMMVNIGVYPVTPAAGDIPDGLLGGPRRPPAAPPSKPHADPEPSPVSPVPPAPPPGV